MNKLKGRTSLCDLFLSGIVFSRSAKESLQEPTIHTNSVGVDAPIDRPKYKSRCRLTIGCLLILLYILFSYVKSLFLNFSHL